MELKKSGFIRAFFENFTMHDAEWVIRHMGPAFRTTLLERIKTDAPILRELSAKLVGTSAEEINQKYIQKLERPTPLPPLPCKPPPLRPKPKDLGMGLNYEPMKNLLKLDGFSASLVVRLVLARDRRGFESPEDLLNRVRGLSPTHLKVLKQEHLI